ncbi:hypothetical protein PHAVU_010G035000 [Phaseolus vulgaris]|uniref:Uncharacterized protein n=1 Tax=Phaseolus vulgaris TaxID=3885 RepID=V7ANX1_PHAVU|nr:hypothetical protein PHAVU_010G035000g [Phaseolus vulgaris]ESW06283.1 hypothetical protein PHAVU_010G035000g [Phaseolus vulgaris]
MVLGQIGALFPMFGPRGSRCYQMGWPLFIEKAIILMINWGTNRFSSLELVVVVLATIVLFPTLVLPSSPFIWVAGTIKAAKEIAKTICI